MPVSSDAERILAFARLQVQAPPAKRVPGAPRRPVVTISRQTGAGGLSIGETLAAVLQAREPKGSHWTVFDKNLVEKVLEDHDLPRQLAAHMPEDYLSSVQDAVAELLGVHPLSWRMVQQTTETILGLAEMGNTILVGRGATVITRHLPHALHVRLLAPLEKRIEHVQRTRGIGPREAKDQIETEDKAREKYLWKYFHANIDDPLLYDLVLNLERASNEAAAELIASAVRLRTEAIVTASAS